MTLMNRNDDRAEGNSLAILHKKIDGIVRLISDVAPKDNCGT
jgi:hypothetical protein